MYQSLGWVLHLIADHQLGSRILVAHSLQFVNSTTYNGRCMNLYGLLQIFKLQNALSLELLGEFNLEDIHKDYYVPSAIQWEKF